MCFYAEKTIGTLPPTHPSPKSTNSIRGWKENDFFVDRKEEMKKGRNEGGKKERRERKEEGGEERKKRKKGGKKRNVVVYSNLLHFD